MDLGDLTRVWRSSHNQPSAAQLEEDTMQFTADLRRRHRGFVAFMAFVLAALVLTTGMILFHLIWPGPSDDAVDLTREWAIVPFFLLPWAAWIYFVVQYRRHRRRHPDYDASIRGSVQALLDENRLARRRNVLIACLQAGFLLTLPLIVRQLKAVGKAGSEIDVMFVLVPAIFGAIMLGMLWNHRRTLLPRKRELEALLKSYEPESPGVRS
jgi:hypothetical protein